MKDRPDYYMYVCLTYYCCRLHDVTLRVSSWYSVSPGPSNSFIHTFRPVRGIAIHGMSPELNLGLAIPGMSTWLVSIVSYRDAEKMSLVADPLDLLMRRIHLSGLFTWNLAATKKYNKVLFICPGTKTYLNYYIVNRKCYDYFRLDIQMVHLNSQKGFGSRRLSCLFA